MPLLLDSRRKHAGMTMAMTQGNFMFAVTASGRGHGRSFWSGILAGKKPHELDNKPQELLNIADP